MLPPVAYMEEHGDAAKAHAIRQRLSERDVASWLEAEVGMLLSGQIFPGIAVEKLARLDAELLRTRCVEPFALIPQPLANGYVTCAAGAGETRALWW